METKKISSLVQRFTPVIFFGIFLLIGVFVAQLHLYIDDYLFLYNEPSLIRNFVNFFPRYTYEFGLYRPLAVVYYFIIYSLYNVSSAVVHLVPWGIHVLTGYLLYRLLKKQYLSRDLSLFGGLLFIAHPFAAEQYMWLGANQGTIANLIFIVQMLLIEKMTNVKQTTIMVALLSLLGVFTYESTFFFFIPLGYLLKEKFTQRQKLSPKDGWFIAGLLGMPIVIYIATKVASPAHNVRPLVDSIGLVFGHAKELVNTVLNLHLDDYYLTHFWTAYYQDGWLIVNQHVLLLVGFAACVVGSVLLLFVPSKDEYRSHAKKTLMFWVLVFITSLFPLFANKVFYFGFRSLFLPMIAGIICLLWVSQLFLGKNSLRALKIGGIYLVAIFLLITISTAVKYENQYQEDSILANRIASVIKTSNIQASPDSLAVVMKSDVSFDSRETFLHADHLLSCFFYEWSVLPCMKPSTNSIRSFAIEFPDGRVTTQQGYSLNDILQERPLLMFRYTSHKQLFIEKIIQ